MSKFKVGDRVRLTKDGLSTEGATGMMGYVRHISDLDNSRSPVQVEIDHGGSYRSHAAMDDAYRFTWTSEDGLELVIDGPIRTRTITEIVPGTYGIVDIRFPHAEGKSGMIGIKISASDRYMHVTASQLTEAISTLTAIRDALEEKVK